MEHGIAQELQDYLSTIPNIAQTLLSDRVHPANCEEQAKLKLTEQQAERKKRRVPALGLSCRRYRSLKHTKTRARSKRSQVRYLLRARFDL